MKRILEILILIAVIASIGAMTGCNEDEAPDKKKPSAPAVQPPNPHEVLMDQVAQERVLRSQAEFRAEEADSGKAFWANAAFVLFVSAVCAFVVGTAIGSKGRKHAGS